MFDNRFLVQHVIFNNNLKRMCFGSKNTPYIAFSNTFIKNDTICVFENFYENNTE